MEATPHTPSHEFDAEYGFRLLLGCVRSRLKELMDNPETSKNVKFDLHADTPDTILTFRLASMQDGTEPGLIIGVPTDAMNGRDIEGMSEVSDKSYFVIKKDEDGNTEDMKIVDQGIFEHELNAPNEMLPEEYRELLGKLFLYEPVSWDS